MGNDMHCRDTEIGDEMIDNMMKEIPLKDVPVSESYERFISCLKEEKNEYDLESFYLDYPKLCEFLFPIVSGDSNKHKMEQMEFFDNVRKIDQGNEVLGFLIILLSNGGKLSQIKYWCLLYEKFHKHLERSPLWKIIHGLVQSLSELALVSFGISLPSKENNKLSQVYSISRQKELTDYIMINYDSLYEKKFGNRTPVPEEIKMSKNDNKNFLNRFFELIYSNLNGNYIRNWLSDEYLKEKPKLINPCDWCGN